MYDKHGNENPLDESLLIHNGFKISFFADFEFFPFILDLHCSVNVTDRMHDVHGNTVR